MAKPKKYKKSPKSTASEEVWARHFADCKDVDKYNAELIKQKARKKKLISDVRKLKSKK
ncbi:hypothetical protein BN8_01355 [Fibrisoma limi BUZ 3]|uniref:Uncharacterized protein n=1 Tax=Fibrisoma limi BUZ 3 TaxID=1185876 RepID=I2GEN4_9BACT|nr:hypothetical protein [Fibrisoma limi]CCH52359.1 hypothetical protein BN8_01355 [Fibrisoma limi BUZ 3]